MSRSGAADAMGRPGFPQSLFYTKTHFFPKQWKPLDLKGESIHRNDAKGAKGRKGRDCVLG